MNIKKIVSDIHNGVQNSRKTIEFLQENSTLTWIGNYPIAIVNEVTRVKNQDDLKNLESINFFNDEGFSKNTYTKKEIQHLVEILPSCVKTAYCLCLQEKQKNEYVFNQKFKHDRWKKITDEENFLALIESSKFKDEDSPTTIETELRDIMRSSKEIPSLKATGFVWIVTVPQTTKIVDILEHYFLDNHIYVQKGRKITYIAWADKLSNINMRYFVNTP